MIKIFFFFMIFAFILGYTVSNSLDLFGNNRNTKTSSSCIKEIHACAKGGKCGAHIVNVC